MMNAAPSNLQSFHRIKRFRVSGGFLDGTDITFADGLNCLIGPRGAGKSTVMELIRFALDMLPGREGDPLRKRIDGIVAKNLDGGSVRLDVETRDGMCYQIVRAAGDPPIVMDENGTAISLSASRLVPADVYSQNQMESIAEKPHYQLDLIDKFAAPELFEIWGDLHRFEEQIRSNTANILPLLRQRGQISEQLRERSHVEERLKTFAKAGGDNAEEINRAHALKALRDRENRALDASTDAIKALAVEIKKLKGGLASETATIFAHEIMDGPNGELVNQAAQSMALAAGDVEEILESAVQRLRDAHEGIRKSREALEQQHVSQELEFRKIIERHKEVQSQSTERSKLEKRRNELLSLEQQLGDINKQLEKLHKERNELISRLSEKRDERFATRETVARRLCEELQPTIRVEVRQAGDRSDYCAFLEKALNNTGIKRQVVAKKVSDNVSPSELYDLVQRQAAKELTDRCDLSANQCAVVLAEIRKPEQFYALEAIETDDLPSISLKDGEEYKESASLSTGQKCTAILPILMFESANPLLIDQPEDNLDNGFIFDTVVRTVRKVKEGRQLIFVTHNPNIPVLGDAAQIVLMQSNGQSASPKKTGDVDACKDHIVLLLEGGEEAFKRRMDRYHY